MSETPEVYEVTTEQIAPPPPQEKPMKVTLASMMVEQMECIAGRLDVLDSNVNLLYVQAMQALTLAKTLAVVAIGIAGVNVVLSVALLVMVAFLLGHVR